MTDSNSKNQPPLRPSEDEQDGHVEALFVVRRAPASPAQEPDSFDLGWLFLCWAWEARFHSWERGLRALARALRGLEENGLIERRRIRRSGRPTHHGFVLTDEGREAVFALSGEWIKEDHR